MKALLIANGCMEDIQFYQEEVLSKDCYDFIVCADGGIKNTLKLGLLPDLIIGDFDSADSDIMDDMLNKNVKMIQYPKEKDESDTELVLDYLMDHNYRSVTMIGCLGNRMDHSLANIYLLKKLLKNNATGHILDEKNDIYLIDNEMKFIEKMDKIVSLIPFSDTVEGIDSRGFYYPLHNASMIKEKPYGISNVIISPYATIKIKSGELLILISKD